MAGEDGRANAGEADLTVPAGEVGRPKRETGIDGLPALGMPPMREDASPGAGEPDLGIPVCKRDVCDGIALPSVFSGVFKPDTRRSRSSSWVLSLGDKCPTYDQIDSPTRT